MVTLKLHAYVFAAASALTLSMPSLPARAAGAQQAASASDTQLVQQIAGHLAQAKGIRAQFTQTQTLSAMNRPLVSTGSLVFFRERGVIWQIDTPYKATYVITDAGVTQVDANGKPVTANRQPQGARGVAQVSKMMRAMLGGDLSALYSQFDVKAEGTPAQWRMQLNPNQPQLAQSIKGLQMEGGDYLKTLRITLANGDVTQIGFANSKAIDALDPADLTLLGAK
ncbi:LolA family protein [Paraburkholderia sartisoli]|uniref:Outer membrane lipoprotein-sorting protein n=1 Tax=Paraburkholderia sartisoli TaxID=83784 RepID=A0A1H3Z7Z1_9BURK|nr:outer membrane lipoprotein carrier protein LolA [Paraburkholderia sartisoli]SEA19787.1 Outer membrane lipoprotein-sorting protein [Paraburkholderia sartisoli]